MFDDFETQVQIDEIIPAEYEEWSASLNETNYDEVYKDFDSAFEEDLPF